MSVKEVLIKVLEVLDLVEVRGKTNRKALDLAVGYLETVVDALSEEESAHDIENE